MYSYVPFKQQISQTAPWVSTGSTGHALTEPERYQWAFKYLVMDLDIDRKIIRDLKITLSRSEDYEQAYSNSSRKDQMTRYWFDVSYEQEVWTGPWEGSQVVHKRVIDKAIQETVSVDAFNDICRREMDAGMEYVRKRIPSAVHRVGCICCYGSGPDLMSCYDIAPNGDLNIIFQVDFDFEVPDESY